MRRRRSTPVRRSPFTGTGLLVLAVAATVAALLYPVWSYTQRPAATAASTGTASAQKAQNPQSSPSVRASARVSTKFGPLSALDRTFLDAVRTAALWEVPAGRQAESKGTTASVRTAGQHVVSGHTFLGSRVADVDSRLGLTPPAAPDAEQKRWLKALATATGKDYDRTFANTLRLADGKILPVVAEVRAGTANSLVRALADDAEVTVLDHIRVLEATGDVDFAALARGLGDSGTSAVPSATPAPSGSTDAASGSARSSAAPKPSTTYSLPPAASSPRPRSTTGAGDTPQRQAGDRTAAGGGGAAENAALTR